MEKNDVLIALEACIGHDGWSPCSQCPYNKYFTKMDEFACAAMLYRDVVALLGSVPDELVSVNMDKVLKDGK